VCVVCVLLARVRLLLQGYPARLPRNNAFHKIWGALEADVDMRMLRIRAWVTHITCMHAAHYRSVSFIFNCHMLSCVWPFLGCPARRPLGSPADAQAMTAPFPGKSSRWHAR
jgi:hypothetical protein